jgi:hypothetical protein
MLKLSPVTTKEQLIALPEDSLIVVKELSGENKGIYSTAQVVQNPFFLATADMYGVPGQESETVQEEEISFQDGKMVISEVDVFEVHVVEES